MLKFITGNKNKFREVRQMLAPIKISQVKLPLDEIQDLDPRKVITHKLKEALKYESGEFIVEDDSLYLECLKNKLPGPFIKWFNDTIGNQGLLKMVEGIGKNGMYEHVLFGYSDGKEKIIFFDGITKGQMVRPKGSGGFGFDPIFRPTGSQKTFGQMIPEEKALFSARAKGAAKLKKYLLKK